MKLSILDDYVERIYLFARSRTYSYEEAEELSQEILAEACKSINNLRDETVFKSWLFGLANNCLKVFKRKKGKEKNFYFYDTDFFSNIPTEDFDEEEETYVLLRKKLSSLSYQYREILIMHYFDGLTVGEMAKKLGIAEGTVKWRLSEGRTQIKKGWNNMMETALRPKKLKIRISGGSYYYGEDASPSEFINDAICHNILWNAYKEPKTVEELSILLDIPAYYIEDAIEKLIKRDALVKCGNNKYQTDFIIHTGETNKKINKIVMEAANKISEEFWNAIDSYMNEFLSIGFYTAGKSEDELKWLLSAMAVKSCGDILNPIDKSKCPYKVKFDGNSWGYNANEIGVNETLKGLSVNGNLNLNGFYQHIVYDFNLIYDGIRFFKNRNKMTFDQINLCDIFINEKECPEDKKLMTAEMIKNGYLIQEDNKINISMPMFYYNEKLLFDEIAKKALTRIAKDYKETVLAVFKSCVQIYPKHVEQEVKRWFAGWLYMWVYGFIAERGYEDGRLKLPARGSSCDVLVKWCEK